MVSKAKAQADKASNRELANKSAMAKALEDSGIISANETGEGGTPVIKGKGYVVKSLEEEAREEAAEGTKVLQSRNTRYYRIFKDHGTTDWQRVVEYPELVRKEYCKLWGFNMATLVKDWPESDQKLYRVFIQHQVDPFQMFVDIANMKVKKIELEGGTFKYEPDEENGKRIGVGPVLELLSAPGTFSGKVAKARLLLNKPTRTRNKGATGATAGTLAAAAKESGNTKAGSADTGLTASGEISGSKKWDLADLQKRSPREACTVLIGSMAFADCMGLVQSIAARLKQSDDSLDKLAGQELEKVYTMYLTKSDADGAPAKKVA